MHVVIVVDMYQIHMYVMVTLNMVMVGGVQTVKMVQMKESFVVMQDILLTVIVQTFMIVPAYSWVTLL